MRSIPSITECATSDLCASCGTPLDAKYFDQASISAAPEPGAEVVLARFDLAPEYCGVLEYFSQWTDAWAKDMSRIDTPGIEWRILANRRPLDPYLNLNLIVNPWGYGSFQVCLRLDESVTLEFVARGVSVSKNTPCVQTVGGRLVGRYWYNAAYGDVMRRRV
jgi:hypothetical protein